MQQPREWIRKQYIFLAFSPLVDLVVKFADRCVLEKKSLGGSVKSPNLTRKFVRLFSGREFIFVSCNELAYC